MTQIIKNYLIIFIVPFLVGLTARFLCRHARKAYLVTVVFLILAVVGWATACIIPSHGNELNSLLAGEATMATVGALLAELFLWVRRAVRRRKE